MCKKLKYTFLLVLFIIWQVATAVVASVWLGTGARVSPDVSLAQVVDVTPTACKRAAEPVPAQSLQEVSGLTHKHKFYLQ